MVDGPEGDGDGHSDGCGVGGQVENVAEFCREQKISRQTFYK